MINFKTLMNKFNMNKRRNKEGYGKQDFPKRAVSLNKLSLVNSDRNTYVLISRAASHLLFVDYIVHCIVSLNTFLVKNPLAFLSFFQK
jgi:hypothetical protein